MNLGVNFCQIISLVMGKIISLEFSPCKIAVPLFSVYFMVLYMSTYSLSPTELKKVWKWLWVMPLCYVLKYVWWKEGKKPPAF